MAQKQQTAQAAQSLEMELLKETFHLDSFREGQREICDAAIAGKDICAVMPTGGGKSLCYMLPAVYCSLVGGNGKNKYIYIYIY